MLIIGWQRNSGDGSIKANSMLNVENKAVLKATDNDRTTYSYNARRSRQRNVPSYEFMAAAVGDVAWLNLSLQNLLKSSADGLSGQTVTFDKNGMAPIHLAASNGHLSCIRLLVEQYRVPVDLPNKSGWRPLHLCIRCGNVEHAAHCLQYLLAMGADPSASTGDGITPMHIAAWQGNVLCLKALIAAKASVCAVDVHGRTPYDLSRIYGHQNCTRLILSAQWYQDKQQVAAAGRRAELERMREKLDEIRLMEDISEKCREYNDKVFKEWLQKHDFDDSSLPSVAATAAAAADNKQYKHLCGPAADGAQNQNVAPYKSPPHVSDNNVRSVKPTPQHSASSFASGKRSTNKQRRPVPWNPAISVPSSPYVPNLGDCFPRDDLTKLPAAPAKRQTLSSSMKFVLQQYNSGSSSSSKSAGLSNDELRSQTRDILSTARTEKSVVHKPHTILDVNSRRHFPPGVTLRSEVALHMLGHDTSSQLFQQALLLPPPRKGSFGCQSNADESSGQQVHVP